MFPNSRPSPGHLGSHGGVEMQEITWGECDGEQKDRGFLGKRRNAARNGVILSPEDPLVVYLSLCLEDLTDG
jgi:hypothetical protein